MGMYYQEPMRKNQQAIKAINKWSKQILIGLPLVQKTSHSVAPPVHRKTVT